MDTVSWAQGKVKLIDQTLLPNKLVFVRCQTVKEVWQAIKRLQVRGAPAIGVCAAFGVLLSCQKSRAKNGSILKHTILQDIKYLSQSRPTAVNLTWALDRMKRVVEKGVYSDKNTLAYLLKKEAFKIKDEDIKASQKMAQYGIPLIKSGDKILTVCNTGGLATARLGTALGVIIAAHKKGKQIKVYPVETRPLMQGSRLTVWELERARIDSTLICDNMAADVIKNKGITKIFAGADRIAANGDTANKIGTYMLAILAKYHHIPFYIVAPQSTVDLSLKNGEKIPIEERSADEVRKISKIYTTSKKAKVYNPAFDVTPAKLITAIITDKGVVRPPYRINLNKVIK